MKKYLTLFFCFMAFVACSSKEDDCETLSIKSFKGFPRASHNYEKKCKNKDVFYTADRCQQALNVLILRGNQKNSKAELKKAFGDRILECFTQNDLNKFLKK